MRLRSEKQLVLLQLMPWHRINDRFHKSRCVIIKAYHVGVEDIGYTVNCTANDTFDGSYTSCCLGTIPSSLNAHTLSDVGKDAAVAHGQ